MEKNAQNQKKVKKKRSKKKKATMVNIVLTAIILFLGIIQRREKPVAIFCVLTGFFNVVGRAIPDDQGLVYYLGAAINDLIIILIISKLDHISELAIKLQGVCEIFIAVNFIGWVLFMLYVDPVYYNLLSAMIYIYTINLILKGSGDVGAISMDFGRSSFSSRNRSSNHSVRSNKEKQTN